MKKVSVFGNEFEMGKEEIINSLKLLNQELKAKDIRGEIAIIDGAAMCLAFNTRESIKDIDVIFEPKSEIYKSIEKIAGQRGLPSDWLNDSVKGFLVVNGEYIPHMQLSNLSIFVASAEYLLVMKCLASRVDNKNEIDDIHFLIKYLKFKTYEEVEEILLRYYPEKRFQTKTRYIVQEVLDEVFNE